MEDEKKKTRAQKATAKKQETEVVPAADLISPKIVIGISALVLTVLFGAIALNADGKLLVYLGMFIQGLVGKAAFYISIPALLYLSFMSLIPHTRRWAMRSMCLLCFVLICGFLSHLYLTSMTPTDGLKGLYLGGYQGTTGGVICGAVSDGLRWLLGKAVSYIFYGVAGILTLLGAMDITVPSLIRAFRNRPRGDWEEEELEKRRNAPEPAAVVVNHIAQKRIAHVEQKRRVEEQRRSGQRQDMDDIMRQIDPPAEKTKTKAQLAAEKMVGGAKMLPGKPKPVERKPLPIVEEPAPAEELTPVLISETPAVPEKVENTMPELPLQQVMEPEEYVEQTSEEIPETMPILTREHVAAAETPVKQKVTEKDAEESAIAVAMEIAESAAQPEAEYCFPPIDLLKRPKASDNDGTEEMRENSRRLNETLASFKIEAHIVNVTRGPSVTRYEVELDKGVRLNKLTTAADDIALSLGASGVRIAAVPGKISVVGIEVPNQTVTTVSLCEVIDSKEFNSAKSKTAFAVGKDIGGSCIIGNIAKLPHMLIAGTTGSGKSVCMNSIIISLLYKASPRDVKLIMIDPKMVELGIYNGIPHLLIPVVTDPKKAAGSLQWAVTEMLRRYKSMSDAGVRDLESYNSMIDNEELEGEHLPSVVVIIDELADLMLVAAKEVEESICRIAQMGRAAGIHLVIATQRPSADVITGLMKANIPSRIAFAVASAMESRIILDTQGAEKLVGKGDMLFSPIGTGKPQRVQGCFVSDGEVEAVAGYVKENYNTSYDQSVMEEIEQKAAQSGGGKDKGSSASVEPSSEELQGDELLPDAVDVILETGQASVSMLQRRLKLGYARAARIVDEMEEMGIVGPFMGSKPRTILVNKEQWQAMKNGGQAEEYPAPVFPDEELLDLGDVFDDPEES